MPYTRIELTCETCGKTFEHRHNCMKSRDIESYNAWAIKNITECPECYKQSRREAKAEEMHESRAIIRISYRDYKNGCELDTVPNSYDPETKTIEVAIERERAMDIALFTKSDDELAKMAVKNGHATEDTAEEYVKTAREKIDEFYADVIGKNWKVFVEKYADQLPEIEEEEEAEEEVETAEEVEAECEAHANVKSVTLYRLDTLDEYAYLDISPCYLSKHVNDEAQTYTLTIQIPETYEISEGAHGEMDIVDKRTGEDFGIVYDFRTHKLGRYKFLPLFEEEIDDDGFKVLKIEEC